MQGKTFGPDFKVSRRSFLEVTAAAMASAGLLSSLGGCAEGEKMAKTGDSIPPQEEGEWKPAACWLNCGGNCYNAAYVVDGVAVRQKSDDLQDDSMEYPQQRGCLRGRSIRHMVYAPDRIRYPMKRKGWSLENPNGEQRGKDEWERISWDEALDLVAAAMKSAIEKGGNRSILWSCWGYGYTNMQNAINKLGGCTPIDDTGSAGTYARLAAVAGLPMQDMYQGNDRLDIAQNADTIVMIGCNPAWASAGAPNWYLWQAKERGAQFIMIGPSYNETADLYDARWIRVRPNTDTALLLGLAKTMLELDEADKGSVVDWDFLNRCCVGFDSDHMPAAAKTNENFFAYLRGEYDDEPKTAEWASEICGTPIEDIKWLAETLSCENNVSIMHSFSFTRRNDTDDIPQLLLCLGAMGGHIGKPGNMTGSVYHCAGGNNGSQLVMHGDPGFPAIDNPVTDMINAADAWNSVLSGRYLYQSAAFADPSTVEERDIEINLIWNCWRNALQTVIGLETGIEAFRSVPCVITQDYNFNVSAAYSDILLPVSTPWEYSGYYTYYSGKTSREWTTFPSKVIEPVGESKTDQWIGEELLKRFGEDPLSVYPHSVEQGMFNTIQGATVITEDGTGYEPLVTITEDDLAKLGFEGKPQQGRITYDELIKQGKFQVPRKAGDSYGFIQFEAFRNDPESNPFDTVSGKIEFYSQLKADAVNAMGRSTIKPYPTYIPALHGYEEASKEGAPYPFQMYNPHYLRRAHTGFDNVPQLREVMPNPVFLNTSDARAKGIETGDTVRIFNDYASCLRQASLTERLMPGCVALPHGTWLDLAEDDSIDMSGSDNWMIAPETSGCGVSGYNSNLVNYEKWQGTDLAADCEKHYNPVGGIE